MTLKRKVLIASNQGETRKALTEVLPDWSLETVFASDAQEARKILETQSIALVFSDQKLADGGFQDLLNTATAKKPPARLVVLLSDEKRYSEADHNNVFDALPFPCRRSDLQWVIIQAMRDLEKPRRRFEGSTAGSSNMVEPYKAR